MDIGQAIQGLIRQAHEQGGRPVGSPRVPDDKVEIAVIESIVYASDAVRCRLLRQGQQAPNTTHPIPFRGSVKPVVGDRVILTKPGGSAMLGWCELQKL
jgi:hypothetical protein